MVNIMQRPHFLSLALWILYIARRFTVAVLATPQAPALDTPAPRSHNRIASDVSDLRHIDTSDPPDVRLHQVRIADAIAQGRPQVIVFATPQWCTSRVCGPVVDTVRELEAALQEALRQFQCTTLPEGVPGLHAS